LRATRSGGARASRSSATISAPTSGAKRAGLDAILVLTGNSTAADVERAAIQPDLVLPSLAELGRRGSAH